MARWDRIKSRGKVDDRRGTGIQGVGPLGGAGLFGVLALVAVNMLVGGGELNLSSVLQELESVQSSQSTNQQIQPEEFRGDDDYQVFASTVLGSNNDVWRGVFEDSGRTYVEPELILFRDATQSGCGYASSQVGPHYCPADESIYIDETFFDELVKRFGARGGDVAEAYVIAHEVGHHVQHELGISQNVQRSRSNEDSIKLELQADCFAGIWAHAIDEQNIFEQDEINEAIDAAEAVGDDRIQESVNGQINPESWTHGSSADRKHWFSVGLKTGDPNQCNTFE